MVSFQEAFLEAFKQFPTYTIIWRLEGQLPAGLEEQKHIKIVHWLPQRDLLRKCFVPLADPASHPVVQTAETSSFSLHTADTTVWSKRLKPGSL